MNLNWVKQHDIWLLVADEQPCPNKAVLDLENNEARIWLEPDGRGPNDDCWREVELPVGCTAKEAKAILLLEYKLQ